ncbi:MAG TPA: DUF188 domain-containing protein [Candidatus Goldiibacteriota bacterium]|nr:DUF188 domain-containing protein [Candidatus Goldiibacteriota bacterium]
MKLIIDADSFPYRKGCVALAEKLGIKAVQVMSTSHYSESNEGSYAETVMVDAGPQAADTRIVNLAEEGDIVLTDDLGLACMLMAKKARAVNSRGIRVAEGNMAAKMEIRHIEKKAARSKKRLKIAGPKKHGSGDEKAVLDAVLYAIKEGGKK